MARSKKKRKAHQNGKTSKKTCFVIMPFGLWFDEYYEEIFRGAIEKNGLQVVRADELYRPGSIVQDIWRLTNKATMMLADLSQKNANVFYELGLAHALNKPVILVTDNIDDVPFDLRALRVIPYNKNRPDWGEDLRIAISTAIKETMADPKGAKLQTFVDVQNSLADKSVKGKDAEIARVRDELRSLRMNIESIANDKEPKSPIPSYEARERIRTYVRVGMRDDEIVTRLANYGVPFGWMMREIKRARLEFRPAKKVTRRQTANSVRAAEHSKRRSVSKPASPEKRRRSVKST
jgi:hypothetical protein